MRSLPPRSREATPSAGRSQVREHLCVLRDRDVEVTSVSSEERVPLAAVLGLLGFRPGGSADSSAMG